MAIDREKVLQAAQKFVEKKKYDKAVLEYQKLIAEDPNDARTLLKIGDLQSKMEAYPDAISTYERVGKFYATQGFALKAIAVYKQIRELIAKHSPQLEERYGHITPKLADLYQQLGLTSDALAALDEVATRLQRQNKDNEAIEVFRKIVELDPTNPLPHLRLAEALSRIKDNDGAVTEFGMAASQLVRLGRRDDALKVIERLLHHKSDAAHARIAAELYLARNAQNDGMQALAKLQICFQANPKDLDTLALLARAFAAIGQAGKGIEVQKEMAKIAREQGKKELFKQLVEKLVRAAPNDEGVKQLVASSRDQAPASQRGQASERVSQERGQAPPPQMAPPSSRKQAPPAAQFNQASQAQQGRNAPVDDLSYDSVVETADIDDLAESEMEPFALRTDRPQADRGQRGQPPRQPPPPPPAHMRGQAGQAPQRPAPPPPPPQRGRPAREPSAPELSIAEDQLEVAEEYEGAEEAEELEAPDTNEQLAQVLADAASFRRVRLYPKAIETLRIGLEIEPRSLDLREFLRDVLIESGDHVEAVEEMLTLASLYVDSLDGDAAARALQDVLAYDPQNYRAREMLHELGYEVIDEPAAEPEEAPLDYEGDYGASIPEQVAAPMAARGYDAYDNDAPLPSYDLEEIGPADVSNAYSDPRMPAARREPSARPQSHSQQSHGSHARRGDLGEIDDPFGADANAPLPSFPLDQGPESEAAFDLVDRAEQGQKRRSRAPSHAPQGVSRQDEAYGDDAPEPTAAHRRSFLDAARGSERAPEQNGFDELDEPATDQVEIPAAILNAPPTPELEEALEEADFFASRGLFEDARTILREQLERLPKHPLLRERIAELDSQEQAQKRGSGTREMPRDAIPGSVRPEADRAFDIAASLDALEASDKASVAPGGFAQPEQQVDVEEVFAKFKEGVAKQISVDDAQSHYDLGVAYKEMGLVDDAVREFETAARDPKRECVCRSMIGMIQIERGNINEAIDALMRGLSAKVRNGEQEVVLMFEVGACYEQKKMGPKALEFYQKVLAKDPNYRDVQERVRRLSKSAPKGNAIRQAAVGADEEFDRAFDDLLSDGKS